MKVEDASEVNIGQFYDVPHVRWVGRGRVHPSFVARTKLIPVLGHLHEDREIIGFPDDHWHIDWRFQPESVWARAAVSSYYSCPATARASKVICADNTTGVVLRFKRNCLRGHITFPSIGAWQKRLEAAYANTPMKCRICPHRGISLVGAPVVNGALVCPGHGLSFNPETGALVPR